MSLDDWPESESDDRADDRANDAPPSLPPTTAVPTPGSTPASSKSSASSRKNKVDGELKDLSKLNRNDWTEREENPGGHTD